jgi:hypothetical protein
VLAGTLTSFLATGLFDGVDVAECGDGLGACLVGRDAGLDQLARSHLDVESNLTRDVASNAELAQTDPKEPSHGPAPLRVDAKLSPDT